ncbi:MAG: amidohydrolase family protein [Lentisphaerae bacterium]|nr:amidohydrolase family protein [Lentisphaerota bacterium]
MGGDPSILIHNARVWPSADAPVIEDGSILVRDGRIETVGRFQARAGTRIDAGGALAMPGFVQAHVHLCQTLFRGAGEDMALLPWLRKVVWPMEAAHDRASLMASARLACAEMIRGGTTSFLSMETVRGTDATLEAVAECGLPGVVGHCLMDDTGGYPPLAVDIDDGLAECDVLADSLRGTPTLRLAVAPRFALSCSADSLREAADFARSRGHLLHTHASEQTSEIEWIRERTGMDNVRYLHECGLSGPDVCLAHCVQVDLRERALLAEAGTNVLHCPGANLKLGSGLAPVPEMLDAGIPVGLGADGAACNNRLDLFAEMRLAGLIQKVRLGPDALPARDIVRMATQGGAAAIGWGGETGVLEAGRRADLVLIDLDDLSILPGDDPASAVVYAAHPGAVVLTMAAGRVLYENGDFTTLDVGRVRRDARDQRRKLARRAGIGRG